MKSFKFCKPPNLAAAHGANIETIKRNFLFKSKDTSVVKCILEL